jgi:anti-sigma regulatory factor (Ser/Thr protein kinase)
MVSGCGVDGDRIEISVPCKPEYVRTIRRAIAEFALSFDTPDSVVAEIEIAASEAVANVIRHAYPGCKKAPPVQVMCAHNNGGLTLEIIDKGCGFSAPPRNVVPEVDPDKEGGLGIVLIKGFMDRVHYTSKPGAGTRIKMTRRTSGAKTRLRASAIASSDAHSG